jgi:hypothetical protein
MSVVIPVRDRRDLLANALTALDEQDFPQPFEVIVVDNFSRDGSGDLARTTLVRGQQVVVLRPERPGSAMEARMVGVAAAKGPFIAFTDSDCQPDSAWLRELYLPLSKGARLVNGPTRPTRSHHSFERSVVSGTEGLYPTCNLAVAKEEFLAAGGFDEAGILRFGFGDAEADAGLGFGVDTLAGWTMRRRYLTAYAPLALVRHQVFAFDGWDAIARTRLMSGFPALVAVIPELRETLLRHRLILGSPRRWIGVLAVLSLVAQGHRLRCLRRLVIPSYLVWVALDERRCSREAPPIAWPLRLGGAALSMANDIVAALSLALGSARARSLVL